MERKNLIIGVAWVFLFLALGLFLEIKLFSGDEDWQKSLMKGMFKAAHVHGMAFGMLNILLALVIKNYSLENEIGAKAGSILALVAAVVFPISLFLGGFDRGLAIGAPLGAISMILAYGGLCFSILKK